jgi:hypothetical protein
MKLYQESVSSSLAALDVDIVIHVGLETHPEIFLEDGVAKPDRHFLIGLIQLCTVSVEEKDSAVVTFSPNKTVVIETMGQQHTIESGIVIFRTTKGKVGCISCHDPAAARKIMRDALRRFTGAIRLDIP